MEKRDFCIECRKETEYVLKKVMCKKWIKDKEFDFEITVAICAECGEEMNIPGLMDRNAQEIDEQYRRFENIVNVSDIEKLMEIYHIGKAPLSLALGFGEPAQTGLFGQQVQGDKAYVVAGHFILAAGVAQAADDVVHRLGLGYFLTSKNGKNSF